MRSVWKSRELRRSWISAVQKVTALPAGLAVAGAIMITFSVPGSAVANSWNRPWGEAAGRAAFPDARYAPRGATSPVPTATTPLRKKRGVTNKPTHKNTPIPRGPLHIIVSIARQRVTLYSNGVPVAEAAVSTGTDTNPTPTGIFSVLQKSRFHRSNLYSNAPMPFMQRLTWSGIALHQGPLPGYPASHGCIRLPHDFAQTLWNVTRRGARVIVADDPVAPVEIAHPALFRPTVPELRPSIVELQARDLPAPSLVPETAANVRTAFAKAPALIPDALEPLAADVGAAAITDASDDEEIAGREKPEYAKGDLASSRKSPPPRPGPISIFVSRKESRLFVRKGFATVFDAPIALREPSQPIGTHLFTAMDYAAGGNDLRWIAITLPPEETRRLEARNRSVRVTTRKQAADETLLTDAVTPATTAAAALDRIIIPNEIVARISAMMSPEATLIISDHARGPETGLETDFIVLTR
ncbi:MAG: L,D-transpeptidase [Proteobacteria bacterium]|nr:L,D-transpeptidase [Pseudomonadota bacterium]